MGSMVLVTTMQAAQQPTLKRVRSLMTDSSSRGRAESGRPALKRTHTCRPRSAESICGASVVCPAEFFFRRERPAAKTCEVFLGGSCNPTTWRRDVAIPKLESAGVSYYNPQVPDWHEGLMKLEAAAKAEASMMLFIVDNMTRGLVSLIEIAELVTEGRTVVLLVQDIAEGAEIEGEVVSASERKDLNRVRTYVKDLVERRREQGNVSLCATMDEAVAWAVEVAESMRSCSPTGCVDHPHFFHKFNT